MMNPAADMGGVVVASKLAIVILEHVRAF